MSQPFADGMKRAKEEVAKANEELNKVAKNSWCPKHNKTMLELGRMGLSSSDEQINGNYCLLCYQTFLAANVSKFEVREEKSILIP